MRLALARVRMRSSIASACTRQRESVLPDLHPVSLVPIHQQQSCYQRQRSPHQMQQHPVTPDARRTVGLSPEGGVRVQLAMGLSTVRHATQIACCTSDGVNRRCTAVGTACAMPRCLARDVVAASIIASIATLLQQVYMVPVVRWFCSPSLYRIDNAMSNCES